jgi:hypothetical protein
MEGQVKELKANSFVVRRLERLDPGNENALYEFFGEPFKFYDFVSSASQSNFTAVVSEARQEKFEIMMEKEDKMRGEKFSLGASKKKSIGMNVRRSLISDNQSVVSCQAFKENMLHMSASQNKKAAKENCLEHKPSVWSKQKGRVAVQAAQFRPMRQAGMIGVPNSIWSSIIPVPSR